MGGRGRQPCFLVARANDDDDDVDGGAHLCLVVVAAETGEDPDSPALFPREGGRGDGARPRGLGACANDGLSHCLKTVGTTSTSTPLVRLLQSEADNWWGDASASGVSARERRASSSRHTLYECVYSTT